MLQTTEDAFYTHISTPGWKSVLMRYFPIVVTTIAIVLGLAVYGFLVSQLVGRRTRELLRARAQQEDAQRKFEALERVSIVGQMSSVVAHELRQPITAIGNFQLQSRSGIKCGITFNNGIIQTNIHHTAFGHIDITGDFSAVIIKVNKTISINI